MSASPAFINFITEQLARRTILLQVVHELQQTGPGVSFGGLTREQMTVLEQIALEGGASLALDVADCWISGLRFNERRGAGGIPDDVQELIRSENHRFICPIITDSEGRRHHITLPNQRN